MTLRHNQIYVGLNRLDICIFLIERSPIFDTAKKHVSDDNEIHFNFNCTARYYAGLLKPTENNYVQFM